MGLLGNGAMVFWHDVAKGTDEDYEDWHSHEHLAERVGIPGFRRGRRCVAVTGAPKYCIMYEVDDIAVLTSQPYLDRLNDPTPWTTRALGHFRNSNRTLCRTVASHGIGIGSLLLTTRFSPQAGKEGALSDWLCQGLLPELAQRSGLSGAHLLRGDEAASRTETEEKKLRDKPDEIADWVVLVEGYDRADIGTVAEGELSPANLAARGGADGAVVALYAYLHSVGDTDLA
jgi:hypothetical protein